MFQNTAFVKTAVLSLEKKKPFGISNKLKKKEKEAEVTSYEENLANRGEATPPLPLGFVFAWIVNVV